MNLLRREPALTGAALTALCSALAVPDVWAKAAVALAALILGVGVRQTVVSPATLAGATARAAAHTATQLTDGIAGAPGQITDAGAEIASDVAADVARSVGGLVPAVLGRTS